MALHVLWSVQQLSASFLLDVDVNNVRISARSIVVHIGCHGQQHQLLYRGGKCNMNVKCWQELVFPQCQLKAAH